jgi:hypothetical protein
MTLTLQVALGIVLAVLILAFLPAIVSFGVIAIMLAVVLAIGAFALYWIFDNPFLLGLSLLAVACYFVSRPFLPAIERYYRFKHLKRSISRRQGLGYDTETLQRQLDDEFRAVQDNKAAQAKPFVLIKTRLFRSAAESEKARRKALGYPD